MWIYKDIQIQANMEKEEKKPEVTAVEVTTVQPVEATTASERLKSFMKSKNPDKEWDDDEAYYSDVVAFAEDADKQLAGYATANETIKSVGKDYPEIFAIIEDIADGKSFEEALAANIDIEELIPTEDEPNYEKYTQARDARKKKKAEAEAYRQKFEENIAKSHDVVQAFFDEKGMDEETANEFGAYIDGVMGEYLDGIITKDMLDMFYNARNYDADVAEARTAGEVAGRNAKIDAEREKKATATDGMPTPGTSAGKEAQQEPESNDFISGILAKTNARRNW